MVTDPEPVESSLMSDGTNVLVEREGGVETIRLNRPDVLNACNNELLAELELALRGTNRDQSIRCVIITGNGRAFCSGQDLADVKGQYESGAAPNLGDHLRKRYHKSIEMIRTMEKPAVAAVNGVAAGAGASLALACDMRIVAESASFVQAFVHVGLVPDCSGTFMLPRLVGMGRAFEMAATGRKVTAKEAVQTGLANQMVPDEELEGAVSALAEKLAALPTKAIGLTKRAFNHAWTASLSEQLEYEAHLQTTASQTQDHLEGIKAFLEKRKPAFEGV
jgi:2-(1,2-epoxy-1,2-dihydrophenyl)acetyl-CoA isomerase